MKTEDRDNNMLRTQIRKAQAEVAKKKPKIDKGDPLYT